MHATVQPARQKDIIARPVIVYADGRQAQWHQMRVSAAATAAAVAAAQLQDAYSMEQPAKHKVNIVLRVAAYPDGQEVQLVLRHPVRAPPPQHQLAVQLAPATLDAAHVVLLLLPVLVLATAIITFALHVLPLSALLLLPARRREQPAEVYTTAAILSPVEHVREEAFVKATLVFY